MPVDYFDSDYFNGLISSAKSNTRRRKNHNIHSSYNEPCQRLFNAIEPDSYIRPHRHSQDKKGELLIAIKGLMALLTFNDNGVIENVFHFGSEKFGINMASGVEVPSSLWHTVVALEPGSVLLEVKAGPFDISQSKELAVWAPEEASPEADLYLEGLLQKIR